MLGIPPKKKRKKKKKKGSSGCYFLGKFPESNKPRASSKSLKRTSLFHEITGGAPISQKVRYDRFCNYYYYYFRSAVICISKSGSRNFREPRLYSVLRTVSEDRRLSVSIFWYGRNKKKSRYVKSPVQILFCLPIRHSKFAFPLPIPLSRACTKPRRTPGPLPNLKLEPREHRVSCPRFRRRRECSTQRSSGPFQVILSTSEDLLHRKNLGPKTPWS